MAELVGCHATTWPHGIKKCIFLGEETPNQIAAHGIVTHTLFAK